MDSELGTQRLSDADLIEVEVVTDDPTAAASDPTADYLAMGDVDPSRAQDAEPQDDDAPPLDADTEDTDDTPETAKAEPDRTADRDAELQQLREERDHLAAYRAQQEQAQFQAETQARINQAEKHFQWRIAQVREQSKQAYDSEAFLTEQLGKVYQERQHWFEQLNEAKNQMMWQFAAQSHAKDYKAQLAKDYNLAPEEVVALNKQPAEVAHYFIQDLAEKSELRRQNEKLSKQRSRSAQAQRLANGTFAPGSGRGGTHRVTAGSYEHYNAIPWERK